jgi:hypothetical protein
MSCMTVPAGGSARAASLQYDSLRLDDVPNVNALLKVPMTYVDPAFTGEVAVADACLAPGLNRPSKINRVGANDRAHVKTVPLHVRNVIRTDTLGDRPWPQVPPLLKRSATGDHPGAGFLRNLRVHVPTAPFTGAATTRSESNPHD